MNCQYTTTKYENVMCETFQMLHVCTIKIKNNNLCRLLTLHEHYNINEVTNNILSVQSKTQFIFRKAQTAFLRAIEL